MAQQPPVGQGLLNSEASPSHSDTPHSAGLLWTSDRLLRTDRYVTTYSIHNRQTSMPPKGFEPNSERPQTHTLDRAVTGIGAAKFWR